MKLLRKIIYIIILLLLISVMLISSFLYLKHIKQDEKEQIVFNELLDIVNENNEEDIENIEQNSNYSKVFDKNSDMVAWIKIEDTNINYPVMQTKDRPNYYLRRNFNKEYSYFGTPYLQENCTIEESNNIIIYGHHIKNSQMFGSLIQYQDFDFYNNHKSIDFITKDKINKYEIIYVFKTSAVDGFKYNTFINFKEENEFDEFNKECKKISLFETGVSSNYGDTFLTLSTCEYSQKNGRFVVVAKKIY